MNVSLLARVAFVAAVVFPNLPARTLEDEDFRIAVLSPENSADVDGGMTSGEYDLRRRADLPVLRQAISRLSALGENQAAFEDTHPGRYLPFAFDVSSKGKRQALRETLALLDRMIGTGGDADPARTLQVLELLHAVQNSFRYPVQQYYQLIPDIFPRLLLQLRRHQTVPPGPGAATVSDPPPTSFWPGLSKTSRSPSTATRCFTS